MCRQPSVQCEVKGTLRPSGPVTWGNCTVIGTSHEHVTGTLSRLRMHRGAISRSSQAPNFVVPLTGLSDCYTDVDNPALHCPDIPPAIAEPPPAPCPPGIDVSAKLLPALDPCLDGVTDLGPVLRTWTWPRVLLVRHLDARGISGAFLGVLHSLTQKSLRIRRKSGRDCGRKVAPKSTAIYRPAPFFVNLTLGNKTPQPR